MLDADYAAGTTLAHSVSHLRSLSSRSIHVAVCALRELSRSHDWKMDGQRRSRSILGLHAHDGQHPTRWINEWEALK